MISAKPLVRAFVKPLVIQDRYYHSINFGLILLKKSL